MLDLLTLDTRRAADEGAVMEVRHPVTNEVLKQDNGEPVTITLAGRDSDRVKRLQRATLDRRLAGGRRRNLSFTADEIDKNRLEELVALTLGWSGIVLRGSLIEPTAENARDLYQTVDWVREQAEEFVDDRANFLKASPTS